MRRRRRGRSRAATPGRERRELSRHRLAGDCARWAKALQSVGAQCIQIAADLLISRREIQRFLELELSLFNSPKPVQRTAEVVQEVRARRLIANRLLEISERSRPIVPRGGDAAKSVAAISGHRGAADRRVFSFGLAELSERKPGIALEPM